jgi:shikimate dehydrogenase
MIHPVQKDFYAVIGNPVAHSLSPVMMNAVFETLKIPAVYLAMQVDDLDDDLVTLSRLGVRGLSVTIPHKESAYRLAVNVDEPGKAMGAVNTLRRHGSGWEGRNTDWRGAITALYHASQFEMPRFEGRRALLIGAGGVARAVAYGLKREGAVITVGNRGFERGEALARAFACDFVPLSELQRPKRREDFDIIVQCTPVGLMDGQEDFALIPDSLFRPGMLAMDTVYRPLWTPFLRKARAAGCIPVSGVEMLLHQGVAQLEWWFGEQIHPASVLPVMGKALREVLGDE